MISAPEAGATTPTELRLRVLANGWHPLPVVGKAPTPLDWSRYCRETPTDGEVTWWGRSHPAAVSTGLALGRQAAIDIDIVGNALLADTVRGIAIDVFGPTPFERVGNAPKTALIYRAGPDVVSTSHKVADGSGDGIDILADGRQVVAFGLHRDTHQPYRWTGTASPLDARPDAAPIITAAQVAEFLARVETIMPLHGGGSAGGRASGGKGSSEEIVRNAAGLVANGRERFLTSCVWRAANALRQAKIDITMAVLTDSAWALFTDPHRGAVLDDGKWKKSAAAYKARATVRRLEEGRVALGAAVDTVASHIPPTYPDTSVPVDEARIALQAAIRGHFVAGAGHRAISTSTGTGKTQAAVRAIAEAIRTRRGEGDRSATLYLVPTHRLADEVVARFETEGVTARTFRGRGAEDPEMHGTGQRMCLDIEAVDIALRLGLTVSTACCQMKDQTTGVIYTCPSYGACSYQKQIHDSPAVWVGAHDLLYSAPAGLGEISSVVVDEAFWASGLQIAKRGVTLDEVGTSPGLGRNNFEMLEAADISAWRSQLVAALRRQEGLGGVERRHLVAKGIDAALCSKANAAEWRFRDRVAFWPGMSKEARHAAAATAQAVGRISKASAVWRAARDLLEREDEDAISGRLVLTEVDTEDGFGKARAVLTHGVQKVMKRWLDVPMLVMDATLPSIDVLRQFIPDIEITANIEAKTPYATMRQILGAPVSRRKLLASEAGRNREAVRRAVLHRFVELGRPSTLIVCQKALETWLQDAGLPAGVGTAHFGAIAGLDAFKDVGLLIVIGRTLPSVMETETYAGALTGVEPQRTVQPEKGPRWYDRAQHALRLPNGIGHPVDGDQHPDPIAEGVRWQVAEAGVIQAIGRARAVNRTAAKPVRIELWNDIALPLTVDEVVTWDSLPGGYEIEMIVDGMALESPSDMAACWPMTWLTEGAAKVWRSRGTRLQTPVGEVLYRGLLPCGLRYQHHGERQKWRKGWYDPAVLSNPKAWLEARIGPLAGFDTDSQG